jgi:hypothetical protein
MCCVQAGAQFFTPAYHIRSITNFSTRPNPHLAGAGEPGSWAGKMTQLISKATPFITRNFKMKYIPSIIDKILHNYILSSKIILGLLFIFLPFGCVLKKRNDNKSQIVFSDNVVAWTYNHPIFDGEGHGDGIAITRINGVIVELSKNGETPISNAKIIELPSNQFGGTSVPKVVATSDNNGIVVFEYSVGAAIQIGGNNNGAVYQSRRKEFLIQANGFLE